MSDIRVIKNFELKELIATGGMASVYKAIQVSLDRTVAIKLMHSHLARDKNFICRFEREAKAAANLNHENIVSIIDFGEADGAYFLAMEFIEGKSLEEIIKSPASIPVNVALAIICEVCLGLDHAHKKGLVHRDIKPANILITCGGLPKITDFGVALAQDFTSLTMTGSLVGTPAYMSPEQVACKKVDQRSDIFSLGVVLYEMVCGKKPFASDVFTALICEILAAKPQPVCECNPAIPPEVCTIIDKMLNKDACLRFSSTLEIVNEIHAFFRQNNYIASKIAIAELFAGFAPCAHKASEPTRATEDSAVPEKLLEHPRKDMLEEQENTGAPKTKNYIKTIFAVALVAGLVAVGIHLYQDLNPGTASIKNLISKDSTGIKDSSPATVKVSLPPQKTSPVLSKTVHTSATDNSPSLRKVHQTSEKKRALQKKSSIKNRPLAAKPSSSGAIAYFKLKVEPWAEIHLDNRYIETTPIAKPLQVTSGTHSVLLRNPNFKSWQRTIAFKANDTVTLDVKLELPEGSLKLVVKPWGDIYIDGTFYETTPIAKPIHLTVGKHVLKVINPTFKSHEETISILSDKTTVKIIELHSP